MRKVAWSKPTTWGEVCKRAGGRRHVNAMRRFNAELRRGEVMRLLHTWGWHHGVQAKIARQLHVSESTVARDMATFLPLFTECEHCGSLVPRIWTADD